MQRTQWMKAARRLGTVGVLLLGPAVSAWADSTEAACVVYPAGSDQASAELACRFYQAQGHVVITRADGVTHDLMPVADTPGTFEDEQGHPVYRQSDLGDQGLIFRLPDESVYVYWDTTMLEPEDENNPTAPFSTKDYDATALFRCRAAGAAEFSSCPGGILRMEGGQASIVVQGPSGDRFTINFLTAYVNATNREVEARLEGDLWILEFANGETWEVPLAAIEGG